MNRYQNDLQNDLQNNLAALKADRLNNEPRLTCTIFVWNGQSLIELVNFIKIFDFNVEFLIYTKYDFYMRFHINIIYKK